MEKELKQKYLQKIYGIKKLYKKNEVDTVNELLEINKEYYQYSKGNMFTESQVLEYGEQCFEAGFAKCDIVEAGLEPKETDIEINWILIKLMKKWQT